MGNVGSPGENVIPGEHDVVRIEKVFVCRMKPLLQLGGIPFQITFHS